MSFFMRWMRIARILPIILCFFVIFGNPASAKDKALLKKEENIEVAILKRGVLI